MSREWHTASFNNHDLIAYVGASLPTLGGIDLKVSNMVRNRHLAKSISDAGWREFRQWLEYFGFKYGKATVAVPPHNTSQNCSNCGEKRCDPAALQAAKERAPREVKKSLSTRTHVCPHCNWVEDRDINVGNEPESIPARKPDAFRAAKNILKKALSTVGHTGSKAIA